MPTVRDLLVQPRLALRLLAGAGARERELAWAHASELADPTEFLEGGELLLLTGVNLSRDPAEQAEYVVRLAAAGVAAVGFGTGLGYDTVPAALVDAADRLGLPVLEVPRATPFLAITRAVAQAVARREMADKEFVFDAQRTLAAAAVGQGGIAAALDEVVRLVGGWGLLLGRTGTPLAAAPADAVRHRAAVEADLDRLRDAPGAASVVTRDGTAETWVQSLTADHDVLGFLAVGRDRPLTAAERMAVNAVVPLLTLSLDRSPMVGRATSRLRTSVLRLLLAGQVEVVEPVARELWNGLPAAPAVVVCCRGSRFALGAAADRMVADRALAVARVVYGRLDDAIVAVAALRDLDAVVAAVRPVDGLQVGVSDPAGLDELGRARTEADRAAGQTGPGPGATVVRYADVPRSNLVELLPAGAAEAFSAALLAPLRRDPAAARTDLLGSLRVWLAHHGQWDPAAAQLGIHRHTLRKRMQRVERLLGVPLGSPDVRTDLWVALRIDGTAAGAP